MFDQSAQRVEPWLSIQERIEQQDWPKPALYVVATPIGNLADLTPRARYALELADVIAAEDTRSSRPLLQAWGIHTPLIAAHRHNERQVTEDVLDRLQAGERVALISDAGAPAISDPGGQLVQDIKAAGFRVVSLPGASACITALMSVGATTDERPWFVFLGFPPARSAARLKMLERWKDFEGAVVMYEAPHRLDALLRDMNVTFESSRDVSLARELTKRFEEVVTLPLAGALAWLKDDMHREQGEYVVIVHPDRARVDSQDADDSQWQSADRQAWMGALTESLSTRDASKVMAKALGVPKDVCYRELLRFLGK